MESQPNPPPKRNWKVIARELAAETDRDKIFILSQELNVAMAAKEKNPTATD